MAQTNQPPVSDDPISAAWELELTDNTNEIDLRVVALESLVRDLQRRVRELENA